MVQGRQREIEEQEEAERRAPGRGRSELATRRNPLLGK